MQTTAIPRNGFTLIEMAIVLVIIGLIVGGILVGQDLIRAAGVRGTITQIEKYNQAVNTFRGKYGYLPGDIPDPDASNFGFPARAAAANGGNGNGLLEGNRVLNTGFFDGMEGVGEILIFWVDLSSAHLIDGGFNTATPSGYYDSITFTTNPTINNFLPAAKIGQGNYIYAIIPLT